MHTETLHNTIKQIFAKGKGLLAADESIASIHKRFEALHIPQTEDKRLAYRKLLEETPGLDQYVSGIIFHDETFHQEIEPGVTFAKYAADHGIIPGIKVDKGLIDLPNFPNEKLTIGLDGLKERLEEYYVQGARFTKWRAVVDVKTSTDSGIEANMRNLALYAALAQSVGLVPIVEPEVLYDGSHTIDECYNRLRNVLTHLFGELALYKVDITGVILKTSFVLSGKQSDEVVLGHDVGEITADVLKACVPENIGGVVFLSGGQSPIQATENLFRVMQHSPYKFPITFSYSRAVQDPVMRHFATHPEDTRGARDIFMYRLQMNSLALEGTYNLAEDRDAHLDQVSDSQDL